jgi:anti-sigma-K factor RskA
MSTNMNIHHLAAAYALDALDERERAAFEAHYSACDICSHDVGDFRATLAEMGGAAAAAPSAALKARVMQQISETRQLSPLLPAHVVDLATRRRRVSTSLLAVAAAVLLIVGASAFLIGRSSQGDTSFAGSLERVLAQPDSHMVDLGAVSGAAAGHVRVAWSPTTHETVFIADGLAAPADGKAYELWLIDGSGAVAMHLLDPARNGAVRRILSMDATPQKWGVTIEPQQGTTVATGDMLFLGQA